MKKIIIFTRYPTPGASKTRLIPALGADGAADLQRKMTEYILKELQKLQGTVDIEICYTGASNTEMLSWLGNNYKYSEQRAGDLGDRMLQAFSDSFNNGYKSIVVIGADCPSITNKVLHNAFIALESNDVVLGPATDGGYYLIGLHAANSEIFKGIKWSTDTVLSDTKNNIYQQNLKLHLLEELSDIDEPDDLQVWKNILIDIDPNK